MTLLISTHWTSRSEDVSYVEHKTPSWSFRRRVRTGLVAGMGFRRTRPHTRFRGRISPFVHKNEILPNGTAGLVGNFPLKQSFRGWHHRRPLLSQVMPSSVSVYHRRLTALTTCAIGKRGCVEADRL
jgi:hypothetical protein